MPWGSAPPLPSSAPLHCARRTHGSGSKRVVCVGGAAQMTTTQHMMDRFVVVGVVAAGLCAQPASTTKSRRGPQLKTLQYDVLTFYRRTCRWESQIWDCRKQVYVGEFFLLVQDIVGEVSEINQGVLGPIETLEFIRSKVCATVSDMLWGMPNLNMIPFMKIVSVAERSFFIGLALIHLFNC